VAQARCAEEVPVLRPVAGGQTACHFADRTELTGFGREADR